RRLTGSASMPQQLMTDCEEDPVTGADRYQGEERVRHAPPCHNCDPDQRWHEYKNGVDPRALGDDAEIVQDNARNRQKRESNNADHRQTEFAATGIIRLRTVLGVIAHAGPPALDAAARGNFLGNHQLASPRISIVAGTNTKRINVASIKTAMARPDPKTAKSMAEPTRKLPKTHTMMAAAAVIT